MAIYRLMIKKHTITGLKYLCITRRNDWENYTGSGVRWTRHLHKHGNFLETKLIFSSSDYEVFKERCISESLALDVVGDPNFANYIIESGYDGENDYDNLSNWWQSRTESQKQSIYAARKKTLIKTNRQRKVEHDKLKRDNPLAYVPMSQREVTAYKVSQKNLERWSNLSDAERKALSPHPNARLGYIRWINSLSTTDKIIRNKQISSTMVAYFNSLSDEEKSIRTARQVEGRLNMSPEAKLARKTKLQELHKTGIFKSMHEEMSKKTYWSRKSCCERNSMGWCFLHQETV